MCNDKTHDDQSSKYLYLYNIHDLNKAGVFEKQFGKYKYIISC